MCCFGGRFEDWNGDCTIYDLDKFENEIGFKPCLFCGNIICKEEEELIIELGNDEKLQKKIKDFFKSEEKDITDEYCW